ncbi:adenosylcobinamide-phosphate synthase CbiB [Cellvibrio polysaccharolyticus]|uniref:Cobalamin biosynthesis protein CobD n=1 Tax=Cellvibrio polysaccharolyticus TaxID=2082724 RepID=A0A928V4C9_9GAMM|nr:adenosylcobinamide-phosphate synthase CbiB [Cellvibrio polysaccharolyticus]MBE8716661.1 cobalamin biosynthesis protein CobD [Cellvibrio polysaccharolyticus]
MLTAIALLIGALLDRLLGEAPRYHPLVGFGNVALALEKKLNRHHAATHSSQPSNPAFSVRLAGIMGLLLLIVPPGMLAGWLWYTLLKHEPLLALAFGALALYWSLGWRSLTEHVQAVGVALQQDLPAGRAAVQRIVSRECDTMDESQVVRASLETLLENTSDAVIGPLFWFVILGPAGAIVYRLSNTLDAMWGYRTARFSAFGWAAARWDDLINLIPARLTALAFAITGNTRSALHSWRTYAPLWSSPNGGPVICAGSGALQVSLGGGAVYHGQWQDKPATPGHPATPADVDRALALVKRSVILILSVLVTSSLLCNGVLP